MDKHQILQSVSFGQRVAEEETDDLATYFVETDQWQGLCDGRYPQQKPWLEKLAEAKTAHTPESLAPIWNFSFEDATIRANELAAIGVFERRGTSQQPQYWVPFQYRDART